MLGVTRSVQAGTVIPSGTGAQHTPSPLGLTHHSLHFRRGHRSREAHCCCVPPLWQSWVGWLQSPGSPPVSTAFPLPGTAPLRFQHEGWSCRSTAASASLCLFLSVSVPAVGHCLFLERRPTWGFQWVPHEGTRPCSARPSHTAQHLPWPSMGRTCRQTQKDEKMDLGACTVLSAQEPAVGSHPALES